MVIKDLLEEQETWLIKLKLTISLKLTLKMFFIQMAFIQEKIFSWTV